ncbi:MAG: aldehyde ferredoxin oxidoreductase C-terminal domain-containing protein, partial [Desulfobacterales bacterium]|nr:aldehyde ferredoxin oxidoreductase C-terminal domain-containing protein [Desulfobacterales bacterium]
DKENIKTFSKQVAEKSRDNPSVLAFKSWGTPNMVRTANLAGTFPTRYWAHGFFNGWENISSQALHERCSVKPHACPKCFISCGRMTTIVSGRHAGLKIEGPEYETIYAFGGICLIDSIEEIAYLNDICDRLGMDTITAGNLCGFTIEAARKKRIEFHIDYGDVDGIAGLLKMIAKREGVGDILARGIRYAAKEWNLEDFAVHVKGLELPGYDPRSLKGSGLGFAVSERGACHLRANFHNPELTGLIDPDVIKDKAKLFVDFEDRLTIMDVLILCRFYKDQCSWEGLSQLIQITTGLKESKESLQKRAAEITDMIRCFNIREGLKPEDDNLPRRLYKKFHKTKTSITEDELKTMLKDYYNLRGWNQNGLPKVK